MWKPKETITCLMAHVSDKLSSMEDCFCDNGCTMYMTGKKGYLEKLRPHLESFVTFGDGTRRRIKGIGELINQDSSYLIDMLLVEGLNTNLVSISQFCDQSLTVNFNKAECIVTKKDHEMMMKGSKSKYNCYLWIHK